MIKVRIGHEDVFIAQIYNIEFISLAPGQIPLPFTVQDPIQDEYHFQYNSR
jgi:hypothetical protein